MTRNSTAIHDILFPGVEYDHDSNDEKATSKDGVSKTWRSVKCDVQALWCHIHYGADIFVTEGRNFHKATKKSELLKLGAKRIDALQRPSISLGTTASPIESGNHASCRPESALPFSSRNPFIRIPPGGYRGWENTAPGWEGIFQNLEEVRRMPTGIRRPINLVLGSQKVQLAYYIKSPTGAEIIAADVPALGLHLSVFPRGFVHISDEHGLDERIDLCAIGANRDFENEVFEWAEEILESADSNLVFDEDLLAMPSPASIERSLVRKSPESIDVDPLGVLRDSAPQFPFFLVDSEAVPQYLAEFGPEARPMFAPKSNRVVYPLDSEVVLSFEFDPSNVLEFVRRIPMGARLVDLFRTTLVHLTGANDPLRAELPPRLQRRFQSLDVERLRAEIQAVLGTGAPSIRRYTRQGFELVRLD